MAINQRNGTYQLYFSLIQCRESIGTSILRYNKSKIHRSYSVECQSGIGVGPSGARHNNFKAMMLDI